MTSFYLARHDFSLYVEWSLFDLVGNIDKKDCGRGPSTLSISNAETKHFALNRIV